MKRRDLKQWAHEKGYKVLYEIEWAYVGWEGDNAALVVEDKRGRYLLRTSHGSPHVADQAELAAYAQCAQGWASEALKALKILRSES